MRLVFRARHVTVQVNQQHVAHLGEFMNGTPMAYIQSRTTTLRRRRSNQSSCFGLSASKSVFAPKVLANVRVLLCPTDGVQDLKPALRKSRNRAAISLAALYRCPRRYRYRFGEYDELYQKRLIHPRNEDEANLRAELAKRSAQALEPSRSAPNPIGEYGKI